jgi:hypothetical protein
MHLHSMLFPLPSIPTSRFKCCFFLLAIAAGFIWRSRMNAMTGLKFLVGLPAACLLSVSVRLRIHHSGRPRSIHHAFDPAGPSPPRSQIWSRLGTKYKNLFVVPACQCRYRSSPGGREGFATFGFLAVLQSMRINSYHNP